MTRQGPPPHTSMPKFISRASYPAQAFSDPKRISEQPGYITISEIMYTLLWPVASWLIVLFNLGVMYFAMLSLTGSHTRWTHAEAALTSTISLVGLVLAHRWLRWPIPNSYSFLSLPAPTPEQHHNDAANGRS